MKHELISSTKRSSDIITQNSDKDLILKLKTCMTDNAKKGLSGFQLNLSKEFEEDGFLYGIFEIYTYNNFKKVLGIPVRIEKTVDEIYENILSSAIKRIFRDTEIFSGIDITVKGAIVSVFWEIE